MMMFLFKMRVNKIEERLPVTKRPTRKERGVAHPLQAIKGVEYE